MEEMERGVDGLSELEAGWQIGAHRDIEAVGGTRMPTSALISGWRASGVRSYLGHGMKVAPDRRECQLSFISLVHQLGPL